MKTRKRPTRFAGLFGIAMLALLQPIGAVYPARAAISDEKLIPVTVTIYAARFEEPLVATSPTKPEEDVALSRAIGRYEQRTKSDDFSSLTAFLVAYPNSGWSPALWTNLGLSYLHHGYFSQALVAWKQAWQGGKSATDPRAGALVDRAVGELAKLQASLGQFEDLERLFDEIGSRPISGSATEAVQVARETLSLTKDDPRHLFICGPVALSSLLLARGGDDDQISFVRKYRAGPEGTNLAEVARLADAAKLNYRLVFRQPGQAVPLQSIVHWKVGHFAAIVGQANGRFQVQDPVFPGQQIWVSQDALEAEASGYFLVPEDGVPTESGWRTVEFAEASGVWGKGPTNGTRPGDPGDPPANEPPPQCDTCPCPMCEYNIKESSVSVTLSDTPVGYSPPIGPAARTKITYNQREDSQPQNFSFYNVSPKWTLNWLSYVTDDPTNAGANVSRYLAGGGAFFYNGYNSGTGLFAAQDTDGSILVLASQSPVTYRRQLKDGSIEIYSQSDGNVGFPRRIFLSQMIDPQGNALTLNYDGQMRLVSLIDAVGRQTNFTYGILARPLLVTQIADPFGRSAKLNYDGTGRLISITDVIGLTSSFTYDANSLVNSLTTPYGTTNFTYTAPGTSAPPRFVQVTDPLGYNEREEWLEPAPIPASDPNSTVPQGMPVTPTNSNLQYRNSFHWDKDAYILAGCTPTGGCDYTKARARHFTHVPPNTTLKSTSLESVKYPLENRIWYSYPGQSNSVIGGSYSQPIATGRVLDNGTTQLSRRSYDTGGYFSLTQIVDPLGRTTSFNYANQVDLATISQTTAFGVQTTLAQFTYDTQHRPTIYTDAAGQTTFYKYNAAGQRISVTNPLNQTTTYQYDASNNPSVVINANNVTAATYAYDVYARVRTYTDSEGWTATYDYDAADRITKITYPDGTADTYAYDKLDIASYQDRQSRLWRYTYDANRRLTKTTDPAGQDTLVGYNGMGKMTSLTDPKGFVTNWTYDVQSRLTGKQYPDTSTVTYTYETTTSRLKSVTDALGQTKQYSYAQDDRVSGIVYINPVNPTPNVSYVYDPHFPRPISMNDGNGMTQYSYVPVGSLGALKLQQESSPLANSAIASDYDELGRLSSRTAAGAGTETFQYDAIGRTIGHTSDLGSFARSYLGQTSQITVRQLLPLTANVATNWGYLNNLGDRRLDSIGNVGLSIGQFSNYQFTTTPENFISGATEASDTSIVYPSVGSQTATYNNLNQLTSLSSQALSYDLNGNLLSDGQRTYRWDAENRLVAIAYPGQPGKATAFVYDGLSRRTAIASTPTGGGSTTTTSYIWCGTSLCQSRNAANAPKRSYYDEGEFVPGVAGQPYYYGIDQLGSVRRAFASTGSAPAYSYDPYGNALQGTAPVTDFGYAGMFYNADSGLYLTQYRAYDPVAGRWLSRDPLGESSDPSANLYVYVGGDPLSNIDPTGLEKKKGKTPNSRWPKPPANVCGEDPKWNPEGYYEGKGREITWDDQSHGAGIDRGNGPQGGHWDDNRSKNRWDQNGNLLPGSPDLKSNSVSWQQNGSVPAPPWWILVLLPVGTLIGAF